MEHTRHRIQNTDFLYTEQLPAAVLHPRAHSGTSRPFHSQSQSNPLHSFYSQYVYPRTRYLIYCAFAFAASSTLWTGIFLQTLSIFPQGPFSFFANFSSDSSFARIVTLSTLLAVFFSLLPSTSCSRIHSTILLFHSAISLNLRPALESTISNCANTPFTVSSGPFGASSSFFSSSLTKVKRVTICSTVHSSSTVSPEYILVNPQVYSLSLVLPVSPC